MISSGPPGNAHPASERTAFLDSSALVKRHVQETGTTWVGDLCSEQPPPSILVSRIALTEAAVAFCRRCREGELTEDERDDMIEVLKDLCAADYEIVDVDARVIDLSIDLARHHALRAYDAIQLATATRVNRRLSARGAPPLLFVTADERLCEFARAEGLAVENPNDHPSPEDQVT